MLVADRLEALFRATAIHGNPEFYDPALFPWVENLKARTPAIQQELFSLLADVARLPNFQDISPDQVFLTQDCNWKAFMFSGYGESSPLNRKLCPATAAALDAIPGMTSAFFSILAPGKKIPPHRGPYNGVLRCHLGLLIPDGDCRIRVGSQTRSWETGEVLIFDDTYEHEVANNTDYWRVVLFIDFLRPLPLIPHLLNRAVLRLLRKHRFVQDGVKNQKSWEASYHRPHGGKTTALRPKPGGRLPTSSASQNLHSNDRVSHQYSHLDDLSAEELSDHANRLLMHARTTHEKARENGDETEEHVQRIAALLQEARYANARRSTLYLMQKLTHRLSTDDEG